jgi:hypothetical protein
MEDANYGFLSTVESIYNPAELATSIYAVFFE